MNERSTSLLKIAQLLLSVCLAHRVMNTVDKINGSKIFLWQWVILYLKVSVLNNISLKFTYNRFDKN